MVPSLAYKGFFITEGGLCWEPPRCGNEIIRVEQGVWTHEKARGGEYACVDAVLQCLPEFRDCHETSWMRLIQLAYPRRGKKTRGNERLWGCLMIREVLEIITVTGLKLGQTSAPQEAASHPSSHRRVSMGYGRSLPVGSGGLAECLWTPLATCVVQSPSVQFSRSVTSDSLWPHALQHTRPPCPSPTPGACSNSGPSSRWCHPTISSSVISFSSCLQSFPASGSFQMSQFFPSGGQSIGVSASASVLPVNIQDWFPLGLTGLISMQSKGLSRVFSNTTVQKHQFFSTQPSLCSNSRIHTWLLEKP